MSSAPCRPVATSIPSSPRLPLKVPLHPALALVSCPILALTGLSPTTLTRMLSGLAHRPSQALARRLLLHPWQPTRTLLPMPSLRSLLAINIQLPSLLPLPLLPPPPLLLQLVRMAVDRRLLHRLRLVIVTRRTTVEEQQRPHQAP